VKMGFLGTKSTLIPWEAVTVDEEGQRIEVSVEKAKAKDGPAFDDDQEMITPEYENEVRSYCGLQSLEASEERGAYGEYHGDEEDNLRVQRTEEELTASTREREASGLNVHKRVRTDREQVSVPTRHEEVSVERVGTRGGGQGGL
jgi:stress response protein YsnF